MYFGHYFLTIQREKLSNKAPSSLHLLSKCSFTPSKLRFFELRAPKISSCYTTSQEKSDCPLTCWTATRIISITPIIE